MVVELMRQGKEPEMACKKIVQRIVKANKRSQDVQVGFLALRKEGSTVLIQFFPSITHLVMLKVIER